MFRWRASCRNRDTVEMLDFLDISPVVSNPVQSEHRSRGIYSHTTGKNQFAFKAALIIFCEATGTSFENLPILALCPLHLTFQVLKHIVLSEHTASFPQCSTAALRELYTFSSYELHGTNESHCIFGFKSATFFVRVSLKLQIKAFWCVLSSNQQVCIAIYNRVRDWKCIIKQICGCFHPFLIYFLIY